MRFVVQEFDSVEMDNEVIINSTSKLNFGDFVNVKFTKAFDYDLEGVDKEKIFSSMPYYNLEYKEFLIV